MLQNWTKNKFAYMYLEGVGRVCVCVWWGGGGGGGGRGDRDIFS